MDDLTRERYGPLTEADLWAEAHPGVPMPTPLRNAARAQRNRDRRKVWREVADVLRAA